MPTNHKIADMLFQKYPVIAKRAATKPPLREGDLVVDAGYIGIPELVDDATGRIMSRSGDYARVEWRNGDKENVHVAHLVRIKENYIPEFHDSAYELPKFSPGMRVILGNGDSARVVERVTGPTGFNSFRVQIEGSINPLYIGRRVYATPDGMYRVAGLAPDTVAAFYKDGKLSPKATIGCEIVIDDIDQQVGLQKYSSLPHDDGMLFPYEPPRNVTFHMGKVAFPIDVVFVGPHGRIAAIEENCEPGIEQYWSHGRVSAVIEVNGGWCADHDIVVGDLVRLSNTRHAQETMEPHQNRNDMLNFNVNRGLDNNYSDVPHNRFDSNGLPAETLNKGTSIFSADPGSEHPIGMPSEDKLVPTTSPTQQLGHDPAILKEDKPSNNPLREKNEGDGSGYSGYRG